MAVGDVAGKGVPAALYAAFASGTVRARAFEKHPPADLLYRANRTLRRRGIEGFFCTLAFALFDFAMRKALIANSGLPYPLHYRAGTGRCVRSRSPACRSAPSTTPIYDEKFDRSGAGRRRGLPQRRGQRGLERRPRSTARPACGSRSSSTPGCPPLPWATSWSRGSTCFLEGRPLKDDLTLVVVKVL